MKKMCQFESMSLNEKESLENRGQTPSDGLKDDFSPSLVEESKDPEQFKENGSSSAFPENSSDEFCEPLKKESHDLSQVEVHEEKGSKNLFETFSSEINLINDPEVKLQKTIDFMEASLSRGGTPHFKSFWDARNLCLELFKHNISPTSRNTYWTRYSELSKEAKRLREILEEQSAFAAEQIEIAIHALELELVNHKDEIKNVSEIDFISKSKTLEPQLDFYSSVQQELNLLNVQASRINALRKELIKTEMRIRTKNKFFQRLSSIGDQVFPKRKDLIKGISQRFVDDVDAFVKENFTQDRMNDSLFYLREEIKALQGIAKLLTLNTHSFTHTRVCLSDCWDKVKLEEKERKKERSQQKAVFKQSYDAVHEKIQAFNEAFSSNQLSNADANKKIEEIVSFMRNIELGRDELRILRDELSQSRALLNEKMRHEEQDRLTHEEERGRQKRKHLYDISKEIDELLKSTDNYDAESLLAKRNLFMEKISSSPLTKIEKQELEKTLKPLRDIIAEKKEKALLELSEDDRQQLQQLKDLLKDKKERRQEIKKQLESYRKAAKGGSGMDIAQALSYNTQIALERKSLEKISLGIQEIEDKIEELEGKEV
jgi:hypothetical protein